MKIYSPTIANSLQMENVDVADAIYTGSFTGSFTGDGANLTGISSYTVGNSSDNRVITSVDASNGNAEANFTFDGTTAYINGALGVGTDTPTTTGLIRATNDVVAFYSSDERLKDNITPIEDALNKVETLGGYEFDWNNNQDVYEGHDIGVIAQEVEKILPEIVETRDNGYKAVKYEKLTAVLIQAVKELSAKVKELENK